MNTSAARYEQFSPVGMMRVLAVAIGLLVLLGLVLANSVEQLLAYLIVLSAAVLPSVLWIRMGALGIPILPVVSLAYIPYFGWPALSGSEGTLDYTAWEILRSALTVALFLVTATVAWRQMAGRVHSQHAIAPDQVDASRVVRLVLSGLLVGILFHIGIISGWLIWVGSFFGLVRIVAVTFVTVACFLIGVTRAQGLLRGNAWAVAIGGVGLLMVLAWSSLFLVGGMVYGLALALGYVIVARRIPWLALGAVLVTVTILHAGKAEMRGKYWMQDSNYGGVSSVVQLPGFAAEWVGEGISAISTGEIGQSVLERTSLLQMILRVQRDTPDHVDFLRGETYSLLPAILVPRFIDSDKPASQVGMTLLNIHYGILSVEAAEVTAIGWGLVAEAYANFGYLGVIGIALILGAFCGTLAVWSAHAEIVSLPTLASIATMMALVNLEQDFIALFSTLYQSFIAVFIFYHAYRSLVISQNRPAHSETWVS